MACPDTSPGQSQCLHEFELTWARALVDLMARQIVDLNRRLRGEPRPILDLVGDDAPNPTTQE